VAVLEVEMERAKVEGARVRGFVCVGVPGEVGSCWWCECEHGAVDLVVESPSCHWRWRMRDLVAH
jgi:hypothetical protein